MNGDNSLTKTLYVGNLSPLANEELLLTLFGQIGECKNCKIINEPGNDPYAFIEFVEQATASAALTVMNKRDCLGKAMQVNWASGSGNQENVDSKAHFNIFVGDLAPELETRILREAFAPFGEISDVKIIKDPQTLQNKCYGFISFVNQIDAETAIASMNGQWLGNRKIKTNWASRKMQSSKDMTGSNGVKKLDYDVIWKKASENNTTVYCTGVSGLTEEAICNKFAPFGAILSVNLFSDRNYAFVRFYAKESACNAIYAVHGLEMNGRVLKCSWGKEKFDKTGDKTSANKLRANNEWSNYNIDWAANCYQWPDYNPKLNQYLWNQNTFWQKDSLIVPKQKSLKRLNEKTKFTYQR